MQALTFRLLEVYQHVVDAGSITSAAAILSLSQPTISLQLKKLSDVVGLPLIEYQHGRVVMTEAGHAVYRCAQDIIGAQSKLESEIQALQGLEIGSLKLAVVTSAKYIIPPRLSAFCKAHPNINVQFTIGNRAHIINRLRDNQDDLYIFTQPPLDESLDAAPFVSNRLYVVAPPDYTGPDNCNLTELTGQKFLLREQGSGTRLAIDEHCNRLQVKFDNTMIIESNEAIRLGVASGLGLSILSEHTLAAGQQDIRILNIANFPIMTHWQAVTVKGRPISLAAQAFKRDLVASAIVP